MDAGGRGERSQMELLALATYHEFQAVSFFNLFFLFARVAGDEKRKRDEEAVGVLAPCDDGLE